MLLCVYIYIACLSFTEVLIIFIQVKCLSVYVEHLCGLVFACLCGCVSYGLNVYLLQCWTWDWVIFGHGCDCLCIVLGKILPWTWLFVYYIGENFALDMIVCVLCTVWTNIWSMILFWQWMYRKSCCCCWYEYYDLFFPFEIASVELYMFQFVHPFSETCFLFRLNCNMKWMDEALFFVNR